MSRIVPQIVTNRDKKNRTALKTLARCGFFMPEIRKALIVLNRVKLAALAEEAGTSVSTVSRTVRGVLRHEGTVMAISRTLNLPVSLLFPRQDPGD